MFFLFIYRLRGSGRSFEGLSDLHKFPTAGGFISWKSDIITIKSIFYLYRLFAAERFSKKFVPIKKNKK